MDPVQSSYSAHTLIIFSVGHTTRPRVTLSTVPCLLSPELRPPSGWGGRRLLAELTGKIMHRTVTTPSSHLLDGEIRFAEQVAGETDPGGYDIIRQRNAGMCTEAA